VERSEIGCEKAPDPYTPELTTCEDGARNAEKSRDSKLPWHEHHNAFGYLRIGDAALVNLPAMDCRGIAFSDGDVAHGTNPIAVARRVAFIGQ
jgi:hypothetical protein